MKTLNYERNFDDNLSRDINLTVIVQYSCVLMTGLGTGTGFVGLLMYSKGKLPLHYSALPTGSRAAGHVFNVLSTDMTVMSESTPR